MINRKIIWKIAQDTIADIQKIDFFQISLSEYNLNYIYRLLPHLNYYFKIYVDILIKLLPKEIPYNEYFIDFGGGHGFFSLFLSKIGLKVIYCDINPLSVKTITNLKNKIGYGPYIIIEGSSPELLSFCRKDNLKPQYLVSTDLIEHVYDLNSLFDDFYALNPNMSMAFTTGSNPLNFLKAKKLRHIMVEDEKSHLLSRKQFLAEKYQNLPPDEIGKLAKNTRGLVYQEIIQYVDKYLRTGILPTINIDSYNTCNPATGNWTERILSLGEYKRVLNQNHFDVIFKNGFYNTQRRYILSSVLAKFINFSIRYSGKLGTIFSPHIILIAKNSHTEL